MKRLFALALLLTPFIAHAEDPIPGPAETAMPAPVVENPVPADRVPAPAQAPAANGSARALIDDFYHHYLGDQPPMKEPPFSADFKKLRAQNAQLCKEKAPGEVCGFGADMDVFLNAQDFDEHLTYDTAKVKVTEGDDPGTVRVHLNVNPGVKDADPVDYYETDITYKLLRENDAWVVDDIQTDNGNYSAKAAMKDEIDALQHPERSAGMTGE